MNKMEHGNKSSKAVNSGRWTTKEHVQFLDALRVHGQDWRRIAWDLKTRNNVQTHAQKYFKKLERMKRKVVLRQQSAAQAASEISASAKRARRREETSSDEEELDDDEEEEEEEHVSDVSQDTESDTDESDKGRAIVKSPCEPKLGGDGAQTNAVSASALASVRPYSQNYQAVLAAPSPMAPTMMRVPLSVYPQQQQQEQQEQRQYLGPQVQMNYFRPISMQMPQWGATQMVKPLWQVPTVPTYQLMQQSVSHVQPQQQRQIFMSQPMYVQAPPNAAMFATLSTPSRQHPFL